MSKYTEAKSITPETRKAVLRRQGNRSISGAYLTEDTASFHHFVPRSNAKNGGGGVGYEWNIIALTFDEHRAVHDHQDIKIGKRVRYTYEQFITLMRNHLIINYENWSEANCKYKKHLTEEEYGVVRRTRI